MNLNVSSSGLGGRNGLAGDAVVYEDGGAGKADGEMVALLEVDGGV